MSVLDDLDGYVTGRLAVLKTIIALVRLESRLAGLSIFPLLLTICLLLVVMMSLWASSMLLLGYSIMQFSHSLLLSVLCVTVFNLLTVLALAKYLLFNLQQMSFEKTRQLLLQRAGGVDGQ
ncbi:hypothetical protein [Legionella sp. CNM-4043-24]|uniref:hypothetical protein n=1 Tax=Legionella sp. CNM-4043-24 TaxID=3421646 RepID=UPI00403AAFD0